jgi:hypothetical protein
MQPLPHILANYVARHTAPDGRTVLDLVWAFEPDDFRELGGERRPRVFDAATGEKVVDFIGREGGVAAFDWHEDGSLSLAMINGDGLRVSVARGTYATSEGGWIERPLPAV